MKIGNDGVSLHLVNTAGLVIGHPSEEHILNQTDISKIPEMAGIYKAIGSSSKKGVEPYRFMGAQPRSRASRGSRLTGWSMVVTQDEDEFLATAHDIRNAILLIGGDFLALTVAGVSSFFARSITRPINRLVGLIQSGSDEVASAAEQVSSSSQSLAAGSSQQAASRGDLGLAGGDVLDDQAELGQRPPGEQPSRRARAGIEKARGSGR